MEQMPQRQQIGVEFDEDAKEGVYSNLAMILFSPNEFILDFARMMPAMQKAKVLSRVIMAPMNVKALHKALSENIKRFEEKFGEIKLQCDPNQPSKHIGFESSTSRSEDEK
jgi:hypothetical protein